LGILDINPNNSYVRFRQYFNDTSVGSEHYVIKDIHRFDNGFNNVRENWEIVIFNNIRNAENFQIGF